jgi:hypothetical protein
MTTNWHTAYEGLAESWSKLDEKHRKLKRKHERTQSALTLALQALYEIRTEAKDVTTRARAREWGKKIEDALKAKK